MLTRPRFATVALATLLGLAGCEAGPDFVPPAPPQVGGYVPQKVMLNLAPGHHEPVQRLVTGKAISRAWYRVFNAPALDRVVREALDDSPTVAAARATLDQAQQTVLQVRGAYYPQIDFTASVERQKGPANLLGQQSGKNLPAYNLYSVGPLASFSPDVFGANARRVEQAASLAQYQAFELAAAQLTITGDVVIEGLTIASDRAQVNAVRHVIADDAKNLALVKEKFRVGRAPRTDVLIAESQLANDRALLPPLQQQRAVAEDALTVLTGRYAAQWSPPAFRLADFTLPATLPISVPSALVHRRPDILAAEAQLHAASAAIGVATGQLYPSINLSASLQSAAIEPGQLFERSGLLGSVLAGLSAPVFHGGALEAQRQGAIDTFRASFAIYRQVVVRAFGQVADTLRALGHDARLVAAERQALAIASASRRLQRLEYRAGRVDVIKLIDAERSEQQARIGYARARAQRYLDTAQLFVAMGGGWSAEQIPCGDGRVTVAPSRGSSIAQCPESHRQVR